MINSSLGDKAVSTTEKSTEYGVLLVEDHQIVRDAIRQIIGQVIESISVDIWDASSFSQAREIVSTQSNNLDLVICDLSLPDAGHNEVCNALCNEWKGLPVVVISANEDWSVAVEALKSGALGFIPKSSSVDVIVSALRLVLSGGRYFPEQVFRTWSNMNDGEDINSHAQSASNSDIAYENPGVTVDLTPRQKEVLNLMLYGRSNKEISRILNISAGTVKNYVAAILKVFNTTSRAKAVFEASKIGFGASYIEQSPSSDVQPK